MKTVDRSRKARIQDSGDPYALIHSRVKAERGLASEHTCSCGRRAQHWALQHRRTGHDLIGTIHLVATQNDERFARISTSTADYAPLCVECHQAYDRPDPAPGYDDGEGWAWGRGDR